jgi:hypothetical protein
MIRHLLEGTMAYSLARRRTLIPAAVTLAILITICSLGGLQIASAEDFRIETKVYAGDDEKPVSETTTLFIDGVVYDFLAEPEQTCVFRKPGGGKPGRFILLDPERRLRTELTTPQLAGAMEKLRTWAAQQKDPFLRFAANPDFEESFEAESGKLVLSSHFESYTVETTPAEEPDALADYREFLDWYTQLNTLMDAGPPPEPRLRLNSALARHRVIPVKVELTRAGEKKPLRAEHDFTWRLSQQDHERIDNANEALASYRKVSNDEFVRGTQPENEPE